MCDCFIGTFRGHMTPRACVVCGHITTHMQSTARTVLPDGSTKSCALHLCTGCNDSSVKNEDIQKAWHAALVKSGQISMPICEMNKRSAEKARVASDGKVVLEADELLARRNRRVDTITSLVREPSTSRRFKDYVKMVQECEISSMYTGSAMSPETARQRITRYTKQIEIYDRVIGMHGKV